MVVASILHFNSVDSLFEVVSAVYTQTKLPDKVVVVDNASLADLKELNLLFPSLELIKLAENKGVGFGHNYSWKFIIQKYSPDFIWALEHDSIPESRNLEILLNEYYNSKERLFAVNSIEKNNFDFEEREYYKARIPNLVKLENKAHVSNYFGGLSFNGVLIPVQTFKVIGFLREDFFVGFEDIDYTQRIYQSGGKILRITNSFVYHDSFKKHLKYSFGNKVFLFPGNDPVREYYSFRNSLVVHKNYKMFFLKLILSSVYILLFRRRKIANFSAKLLGFYDACNGKMGKRDYQILRSKW